MFAWRQTAPAWLPLTKTHEPMSLKRRRDAIRSYVRLGVCILLPLLCLFIPLESYPLEGISLVERRVVAIFLLAALCWVLEPIPIFATSMLIIVLELVMISSSALLPFRRSVDAPLGKLLAYQDIMATLASPIIMLFLGGFFLAMAATKYRLDINLARVLLRPFGDRPPMVMLGLMGITAVFSMFMSNTATTAMMLSILMPILAFFDPTDKGRMALVLAIPMAANLGGLGTPIGTPPNAIALKYLTGENTISFSTWMLFGVPFALLLLGFAWILLLRLFPFQSDRVVIDIKGTFLRNRKAYVVYATFALTVLLWLTDFVHGMNSYVVAMLPVAVFLATNIITKEDLKKLSWDVLWLVSGGIALGLALEQSGLAERLVRQIPFDQFSPYLILAAAALLAAVMANFMSNTATANLLLPIMAALGAALESLQDIGGLVAIVLGTALACSMGLAMPISTPPNALAYATGLVDTGQMARVGIVLGAMGLGLIFLLLYVIQAVGLFS